MTFDSSWRSRAVSPSELVSQLRDGQRVFVHGAAATPTPLLEALADRRDLVDLRLYHLTWGPCRFADGDTTTGSSQFFGHRPNLRSALDEGRADHPNLFVGHSGAVRDTTHSSTYVVQLSPRTLTATAPWHLVDAALAAVESRRSCSPRSTADAATRGHTAVPLSASAPQVSDGRCIQYRHRARAGRKNNRRAHRALDRGTARLTDGDRAIPTRVGGLATSTTSACIPKCSRTA